MELDILFVVADLYLARPSFLLTSLTSLDADAVITPQLSCLLLQECWWGVLEQGARASL